MAISCQVLIVKTTIGCAPFTAQYLIEREISAFWRRERRRGAGRAGVRSFDAVILDVMFRREDIRCAGSFASAEVPFYGHGARRRGDRVSVRARAMITGQAFSVKRCSPDRRGAPLVRHFGRRPPMSSGGRSTRRYAVTLGGRVISLTPRFNLLRAIVDEAAGCSPRAVLRIV